MGISLTNMQLEALSLNPILSKLFTSVVLPISISFELEILRDKLAHFMDIYISVKNKYIQKYCDKDKDGNPVIANNEYQCTNGAKLKMLNVELTELLNKEITMGIDRVEMPISELNPLNIRASVGELDLLKLVLDIK